MKKILFACTLAIIAVAASAQNLKGTSVHDRIGHGQDSIDVLGSLSLYQEAFKRQSFVEAIEPWEFVFGATLSSAHLHRWRMDVRKPHPKGNKC